MTLWLDVDDLLSYAQHHARPSGIQRVSFEVSAELANLLGDGVRFCRHDPVADKLRTLPWEAISKYFLKLSEPVPEEKPSRVASPQASGGAAVPLRQRLGRFLAERMPVEVRVPLIKAYRSQRAAISAQGEVLRQGGRALMASPALLRGQIQQSDDPAQHGCDIRDLIKPGDVFGILGAPWAHPDYAGFINRSLEGRSVRIMLLVHDLIPLMHPEWCEAGLVKVFDRWFRGLAPHVDQFFAVSNATARDIGRWAAREGVSLKLPARTMPIGTGFSGALPRTGAALPSNLEPGGYALIVSTIEARKNHLLAFGAWRRMLEEMPAEAVPTLVFAGRVGWLVNDLMQQLENCAYLGGKVVVVTNPDDAELAALYQGCRFTLFPSLYEGWGLPVTESLSFGKLCIASDRASVPEAGGDFCLYIDPDNLTGATEIIRKACVDDGLIEECERKIRDGFRPVSWRRSAEVLAADLGLTGQPESSFQLPRR
ncbi:glycosyltransferase family 4 protein [Muricoccus vinaceus]|uniref:Glycosyltransferase family 4 protein n=1 Tax=Muricoccus vinaceus TaxID=424704 RepID=A0ABV6IXP3_9PROT